MIYGKYCVGKGKCVGKSQSTETEVKWVIGQTFAEEGSFYANKLSSEDLMKGMEWVKGWVREWVSDASWGVLMENLHKDFGSLHSL